MIILTPYYGLKDNPDFKIRKKYLQENIDSIDRQEIDSLHVIIDDGSDDGFCDELQEEYSTNNKRIIIKRDRKEGDLLTCTNALNYGLDNVLCQETFNGRDLTKHNLITFLHSDDIAINLKNRKKIMNENKVDFLYTDALLFFDDNHEGLIWKGINGNIKTVINNFWVYGKMPYPTMTWSKNFLNKIKEHNKEYFCVNNILDTNIGCGEDVDIALNSLELALKLDLKVNYLPGITAGYRIHDSSLAEIRDQKKRKNEENSVLKKHFGKFGALKLHVRRLISRPECYFPKLIGFKSKKKIKLKGLIK